MKISAAWPIYSPLALAETRDFLPKLKLCLAAFLLHCLSCAPRLTNMSKPWEVQYDKEEMSELTRSHTFDLGRMF